MACAVMRAQLLWVLVALGAALSWLGAVAGSIRVARHAFPGQKLLIKFVFEPKIALKMDPEIAPYT